MTDSEKIEIKGSLNRQTVYIIGTIISFAFFAGAKLTTIENSITSVTKDVHLNNKRITELEIQVYKQHRHVK